VTDFGQLVTDFWVTINDFSSSELVILHLVAKTLTGVSPR